MLHHRLKEDIEKINNENKINDIDLNECNKLIQEFKNILEKDKTTINAKQEQIENYFLFIKIIKYINYYSYN